MFGVLLTLIFIRPFISSLAFPCLNSLYSALFLIFLITWLIYKGISIKKIHALKYPLILFCSVLIISVVFSINKLNSLKELYKYISGILLFLIVVSLTYENKICLIYIVILAGFVISLLAIYQYFFGFQHILDYMTKTGITNPFALDYIQRRRAFFPFVTPNALGGYLSMLIPLALSNKNTIWFIIPLSFTLLLTKSIGALLSLFLALGIYFYLQNKLEKRKILSLLVLLVIISIVFMTRLTIQKQYLQPIFSTMMRLNYWRDTLKIIKFTPLTGLGLGNFNLAQSRYAHNSYLQLWAEMGILGPLTILWLIILVIKSSLKNIRDSYYIAGLFISNIVFLLHNFIDFTFFLPEVAVIWWTIFGLIL